MPILCYQRGDNIVRGLTHKEYVRSKLVAAPHHQRSGLGSGLRSPIWSASEHLRRSMYSRKFRGKIVILFSPLHPSMRNRSNAIRFTSDVKESLLVTRHFTSRISIRKLSYTEDNESTYSSWWRWQENNFDINKHTFWYFFNYYHTTTLLQRRSIVQSVLKIHRSFSIPTKRRDCFNDNNEINPPER